MEAERASQQIQGHLGLCGALPHTKKSWIRKRSFKWNHPSVACIAPPHWPDITHCMHCATKLTRRHPVLAFCHQVDQTSPIAFLCATSLSPKWQHLSFVLCHLLGQGVQREGNERGGEYTVVEDKSLHSNFRINCEATLQWPDYRSL